MKTQPQPQSVTYEPLFKGHPVLTDKTLNQGCRTDILDKIKTTFDTMTTAHSKVLFGRYDVRFPLDRLPRQNDNKTFRDFQANWMKNLKRKKLDPHYVWSMERSSEKHQHYHGVLMLDGNKTKSIYNHLQKAETLWANALGLDHEQASGLINDCTKSRNGAKQKNGIMLRKDDPEYDSTYDRCFQWASYLAKTNTKSNLPKGCRVFGSSSIPKHPSS